MSRLWTFALVLLVGCGARVDFEASEDGEGGAGGQGVLECESDVAPRCVVVGELGSYCQHNGWCQDGLVCDMTEEDWHLWECVDDPTR